MSDKSFRKIGFFSALSICLTSIVGIGIFLKNASIGKSVDGNGTSWLLTWIISGLIAILLAFHFGKISIIESKKGLTGLNSWVDNLSDKKNQWFKKIVSINYGYFYNPILSLCLSFFCTEFLILFIQTIAPSISFDLWVYFLITLCFLVFFILNNYFSIKISGYISITTSILKFIPLLMAILIGLIFANIHNIPSHDSLNGFNQKISFGKAIQGIVLSIPSALFAFDSFVGVGTFSKNVKGGTKTVSKVIIVSMILVTVIYCLICLSSIFHFIPSSSGGTTILNVLIDSLPTNVKKGITIFVSLFIFISAFGTSNSIIGSSLNEYRNIIINQKTRLSQVLFSKFKDEKKSSLILAIIIMTFWSIVMFVPSMIINNDSLIDGFSNLVVIYIFLIYAYTIFLFWKNYFLQNKITNSKIKNNVYTTLVWLSIILTLSCVLLNIVYIFINGISDPFIKSSLGLFISNGNNLSNLNNLILYVVFSIVFLSFPFIVYKERKIE